ncbi:MAG TPA: Gfo/Idh/MocA family oxidoreductase [Gemmatimonadales bacterium]|jgi:predicted dehydrogenase/nucleoside-diphosphate-sugar epimerase|nr:Gfo/Idh/MocA family oxidoreductase [Gemmatimonadales bacterium]
MTGIRGSRPLRIAFIGAGAMAGHHLDALRRVSTAHSVVGVQDTRDAAAQAFARRAGARAYATVSDLLQEARPDLVHICTPAGTHFEPARQALLAGAHVYVEKPFVETPQEAETLFALARQQGVLICAGHQLVRDPAFRRLIDGAAALKPVTLVDSTFAFRPPRLDPYRSTGRALAEQLLDVLPHPLYTLVAVLETFGPAAALEIVNVTATPTALYALLRAGDVTGRLCISLRARPVASTLTVAGAHGSLTADFVRAIVLGAANEGTSPLEKILNPFVEAAQLAWRSATGLARRLLRGADYPGLAELLGDFYAAASTGDRSPISVDHLRRVTAMYEHLAANLRSAVSRPATAPARAADAASSNPVAVVTGAGGFFGRAICRELARRGFRIRGIGRSERPDDPHVHEWIRADLADGVAPAVFAGAAVVVHAAAETAGGFEAHERNTVGTTRHLLRTMAAADVHRLLHVSSISVLRPPHGWWERQGEHTPRAARAERLGAYTWGKCAAEELVAAAQARGEIQARIIRPGALIDWGRIELPGLLGRRLFGRWQLGLGRPGLPIAVCDVGRAAAAVAWYADHFADAPPVVNLFDPAIRTRGQLLRRFRRHGWRGRVLWVPISVLSAAVIVVRAIAALARRERARPLAVWSILRPRRYDPAVAAGILAAASEDPVPVQPPVRPIAARVSRAYG